MLKAIKEKIPPRASDINDLVENIASLSLSGDLNKDTVFGLVGHFSRTFNIFDFLKFYLEDNWNN